MDDLSGKEIRGYKLIERIGEGGFGVVYRAEQPSVDREVAIKVILPEYAKHPDFVRRFDAEARMVAKLEHFHIVPLYDYWRDEEGAYLVMRWLRGGNLREALKAGPWDVEAAGRLLQQIAEALTIAHEQGVIHRDLKPENILLDKAGNAYLTDFGIAKDLGGEGLTQTGKIVGSVDYLAPEQAKGEEVTPRTDIYGLGVVLYEMLTGEHPFPGLTLVQLLQKHLNQPLPSIRASRTELPETLDQVVQRATAKDPAERYSDAIEIVEAYQQALISEEAPPPPRDEARIPSFLEGIDEEREVERPVFVARDRELAQLNSFLEKSLTGHGQVVFVTGGAGRGKTALVDEFCQRAQDAHTDLIVATGNCNAQTGIGDPYLPFRDVFSMLTGDVEGKLASGDVTRKHAKRLWEVLPLTLDALLARGPSLVDVFIPGEVLLAHSKDALPPGAERVKRLEDLLKQRKSGVSELEQSLLFEQCTNVLNLVSNQRPLLLFVDDLQWADNASISLLFHLGRRISSNSILIVGSYRPDEVALGREGDRHPLEGVVNELKRKYGDVIVDLSLEEEAESKGFVEDILDAEPNFLNSAFRQALYEHTGGHPLFTVELLRAMQERGDIIKDEDGRWVEGLALAWDALPARVEAVIEERISRLEEDLRETLSVASVEGEDFTAEVVARVRATDERGLIQQLSRELDKRHRLVIARGVQRVKEQRLSAYQFQHSLFQSYLYNELSDSERAYLHEDVGRVLEALYGDQADKIAVQLARHFVEAELPEKAVTYLQLAGQQAISLYAYQEASVYLTQALEMLPVIDGFTNQSERELMRRYEIHLALADVYATLGQREAWQKELATLCQLAETLNDDLIRAKVSLRESRYAETTGDYPGAIQALEATIDAACSVNDVKLEAQAVRGIGYILWRKGDFKEAHIHLDKALKLSRKAGLSKVEAGTLHSLAVVHWRLGEYGEAKTYAREALELGPEIGDRQVVGMALNVLGSIHYSQGKYEAAKRYYEDDLRNNREVGNLRGEAMSLGNLGMIAEIKGDFAGAMAHFKQVRAIFQDIGDRGSEARAWAHMGKTAVAQGVYDKGQVYYHRALDIYREIDNQQGEGWVKLILASLLNKVGDYKGAIAYSREALKITQESGARSMEGGVWTVLACGLANQGKLEEAADAYRVGLDIRSELEEKNVVMESLSGLAQVALEQGERLRAKDLVEEVLQYIEDTPIEGTDEPLEIYLTCYHVLRANQDPRADKILAIAHELLHERAARISDEDMRRSFLENVAPHREIVREFARSR